MELTQKQRVALAIAALNRAKKLNPNRDSPSKPQPRPARSSMKPKLGTDRKTTIPRLDPPKGATQAAMDSALTEHQSLRDAESLKSMRFCGGMAVPYLRTALPESFGTTKPLGSAEGTGESG